VWRTSCRETSSSTLFLSNQRTWRLRTSAQAYQLRPSQAELAQQLLEKAQQRKLLGLEINPSYGAECRALFRTVEILPNHILPRAIADVST
jgi:hypothetical protein